VAGCCEHGNEYSGSVKMWGTCDWLRNDPAPWTWLVKQNTVVIVKPAVSTYSYHCHIVSSGSDDICQ